MDVAALAALATEKMLQRTPRGWSEAKQLARALDPAGSGSVTRASYRAALARVGLAAVSDDDADAAFARLAGDAFASVDEVPTAAFVRRALPPSYAERPAKADVLRELRDAGAADEMFRVLMGDKVEPRREFIEKHALDVRNLDV